jgi:hypothetical protein
MLLLIPEGAAAAAMSGALTEEFSDGAKRPLRRRCTALSSSPPVLANARRTMASPKPMEKMTGRGATHGEVKEEDSSG